MAPVSNQKRRDFPRIAVGAAALIALSGVTPGVGQAPTEEWALSAGPTPSSAPANGSPQAGLEWQILEKPNGPHVAVVFDPVRRVLAVYHIDPTDGAIKLKSVRSLGVDLRLRQFNSSDPTPDELQAAQRPGS
ncbi:MAG: hypothetical protein AAF805_13400 [Planctomycetota bacterium]